MAARTGRKPEAGLGLRECAACGVEFQPYRSHQIACSRRCMDRVRAQSPRRELWRLTCGTCGGRFDAMWSGMGTQPSCPDCTEAKAKATQQRKNAARLITTNPRQREVNRRSNLFRNHGITLEQFEAMSAEQGGGCAICGSTPNGVRASYSLHVDHDHVTGENRSLLCTRCNQGIGYFKDDPALLRLAADYIERHRMQHRRDQL